MYKRFISNIAGYGLFAMLNHVGGIFLLPYYWSVFGLEQFYIIGLFQLTYYFLLPLMAFGLNTALERFYYAWEEQNKNQKIFGLFTAQITFSTLLFLCVLLIANLGFGVEWHFHSTIFMACIYAYLMSTQYIPMAFMRVTGKVVTFGLLSNASFLSISVSTILFINLFDKQIQGFVIGQVVGASIIAIIWILFMIIRSTSGISLQLKDEFLFAWSIPPMTLIQKMSEFGDRLFAERLLSNMSFGTYTVAAQIGSYFNTTNSTLKMAFFPIIYQNLVYKKETPESINPIIILYCFVVCLVGSVSTVIAEGAMMFFGGDKYMAAIPFIKYFILVAVISAFGVALGVGLEIKKRVHLGAFALIPSILVTISLSYCLMPKIGIFGGVFAVLAGTLTKSSIRIWLANRAMPRKFPKLSIALLVLTYFGLLTVFETFPAGDIPSLVKELSSAFFVYALIGFVLSKINNENKI